MRYVRMLIGGALVLGLAACGGEEAQAPANDDAAVRPTLNLIDEARFSRPPKIDVPDKPPPSKLVVKTLEEGPPGPGARWGNRLSVQFVGVHYETREIFEVFWGKSAPFAFNFGSGEVREGWETGLKGMRVGERRELILPSRLAYGTGPLLYVVELLDIKR